MIQITGTPTTPGLYSFVLQATDSASYTATVSLTILVAGITPSPQPAGDWQFLIALPQPDGTYLAEVAQASAMSLTLRCEPDQAHEASFTVEGTTAAAVAVLELQTDLHVLYKGQLVFVGRIGPATDTFDSTGHHVTFTASDYREVLRRRALLPSDTLGFSAVDQALIAWDLIAYTQGRAGGQLGISRGRGQSTGVPRTITFTYGDMIGDDIAQMLSLTGGAEWQITPYQQSDLRLDIFYPQQGADNGVVVSPGDDRVAQLQRNLDPSTYATGVYVTGGTGTTPVWPNDVAGLGGLPGGRWDQVQGTDLTPQTALNDAAAGFLASASLLVPSYTVTFAHGSWGGPSDIWMGDTVTIQVDSGRLNVNDGLRAVELAFTINPANGEAQLNATVGTIPLKVEKKIPAMLRRLRYLETR